jgi:hypothetical protein
LESSCKQPGVAAEVLAAKPSAVQWLHEESAQVPSIECLQTESCLLDKLQEISGSSSLCGDGELAQMVNLVVSTASLDKVGKDAAGKLAWFSAFQINNSVANITLIPGELDDLLSFSQRELLRLKESPKADTCRYQDGTKIPIVETQDEADQIFQGFPSFGVELNRLVVDAASPVLDYSLRFYSGYNWLSAKLKLREQRCQNGTIVTPGSRSSDSDQDCFETELGTKSVNGLDDLDRGQYGADPCSTYDPGFFNPSTPNFGRGDLFGHAGINFMSNAFLKTNVGDGHSIETVS